MHKSKMPELNNVAMRDSFFAPRIETNSRNTLPANIAECRRTGRIDAFKLNWREGMPDAPHVFWDSDFAKVLEGFAMDLMIHPDPEKKKELDEYVALVVSTQQKDGYLNTHFTVVEPEARWTKLSSDHELYCAGHLMEAAVAHFNATGERNFLDCMCRYADYIAEVFGAAPGQKRGYPGHEEIELALCKLAEASGNGKYFELAKYFIDERGREPNYFMEEAKRNGRYVELSNLQAHKPVREQERAIGHAVRALYLYSGMADVAAGSGDFGLFAACERLWKSVTEKNMYITGGVGSTEVGEAFTVDYNLPNSTAYAESCASIALVLFASRMLNITGNGVYADVMEKALYNGAMSGLSLDGVKFFYSNPLEVDDNMNEHGGQIRAERQPWFGCSCCPTNYCRFIPQTGAFAFSVSDDSVSVNIPAAAECDFTLAGGRFAFDLSGGYPYDGHVSLKIREAHGESTLRFRVPGWCEKYSFRLNGKTLSAVPENGYISIRREWLSGDLLEANLEMPVRCMRSNGKLTFNAGRIALMRGPLVYALESVDNGGRLSELVIPAAQEFEIIDASGLPQGTKAIRGTAFREVFRNDSDSLYFSGCAERKETQFTAIPEALWQNRGKSSMYIWIRTC